jgi:hypothetical protein
MLRAQSFLYRVDGGESYRSREEKGEFGMLEVFEEERGLKRAACPVRTCRMCQFIYSGVVKR